MRVHELPSRLRARGVTIREVGGWEGRGYEFPQRPDGALRHWDAIASKLPTAGLSVITNGRPDLKGPLAQVYKSRYTDGNGLDVAYVVASGKANHAGAGIWNGISGNYNLLGLEIAWSGPGEAFPAKRKLTSELIMRALLDCCAGTNTNDAAEHREYATPPGRKIDTNLDGNELRRRMRELGNPGSAPAPAPAPQPAPVPVRDRLRSGESLAPGQFLQSVNRCFTLHHQPDGNLVIYMGPLYRPDTAVWTSGTNGTRTSVLAMQPDGNLVLYAGSRAVWNTGTQRYLGAFVVLQDDGNLVIYQGGRARWNSQGH
jgi:hypothetical protein